LASCSYHKSWSSLRRCTSICKSFLLCTQQEWFKESLRKVKYVHSLASSFAWQDNQHSTSHSLLTGKAHMHVQLNSCCFSTLREVQQNRLLQGDVGLDRGGWKEEHTAPTWLGLMPHWHQLCCILPCIFHCRGPSACLPA
jgi:hypothetical protein